jgi:hypothetical protein
VIATVGFVSPFQVLSRQLTLKPKGRKPLELGPKVRVETVRLSPASDEDGLLALINGAGLSDRDKNGLKRHSTDPLTMWQGACTPDLKIEFELPEPVPLAGIEVWNFNADWQTTNGIRKADVAVSADGTSWQTVLAGAEFAEAEGTPDYDTPVVLKLDGALARKVRLENIAPWNSGGKVGLSEVVFHQTLGPWAAVIQPEDGATSVRLKKTALEWTPGQGASEHRVYLGAAPDKLALLGATKQTRLDAPDLKAMSACFWRVDELQPDGKVVTGRVVRFDTTGLVAWWKLNQTKGVQAEDAAGHQLAGRVKGQARWIAGQGRLGGALEFDGAENFVDCGASPEFDLRDSLSVSVWIKVRQFDKSWQTIVAKGNEAWRLRRLEQTDRVALTCNGLKTASGAEPTVASSRSVNDGQWHHLVGVYDGAQLALYLDGALESSLPATGQLAATAAPLFIGENPEPRGYHWNGWMDDVRLYSCALTSEEVRAIFRAEAK